MGERYSVALLKELPDLNPVRCSINISPLRGFSDSLLKSGGFCATALASLLPEGINEAPCVNAWASGKSGNLQRLDAALDPFAIKSIRRQLKILLIFLDCIFSSALFFVQHSQATMGQRRRIFNLQRTQIEVFRFLLVGLPVLPARFGRQQIAFLFFGRAFLSLFRSVFLGAVCEFLLRQLGRARAQSSI